MRNHFRAVVWTETLSGFGWHGTKAMRAETIGGVAHGWFFPRDWARVCEPTTRTLVSNSLRAQVPSIYFERFVRLEHLSLGVPAFDRGERHALRVGSVESLVVLARSAGGFEIILRNRPV